MKVALIVAMAKDRAIGLDGSLPWSLPADLRYFKKTTMGAPVIMGRKTYDSLFVKPLPGRRNIVLTRNTAFVDDRCEVVYTLEEAIALAKPCERVFIIGGASVYEQALDLADELYITSVDARVEADQYFPPLDLSCWAERQRDIYPADERNAHDMEFIFYERRAD